MQAIGVDGVADRRSVLPVIAISIAMLAAGCGGDSSGSDGGDATGQGQPRGVSLSRSEFIEEASKGCREMRSSLKEEVSRFLANRRGEKPRPVLYADLAHFVLLPTIEAEMESIRYLGVPPSEERPIEKILDDSEYTINEIVFQQRIPSIDAVYRQFAKVIKGFRAYGLPACANGSSVTSGGS